jgi:hypothetical protein
LFPPLEQASTFVQQAARILANHEHGNGQQVRASLQEWLACMQEQKTELGPQIAKAIDQFVRTTRSFTPGLFHCYDVPDLPATNNDLEQYFGSVRYHERRTTGRKTAVPAVVVRGSAHVVATVASKTHLSLLKTCVQEILTSGSNCAKN